MTETNPTPRSGQDPSTPRDADTGGDHAAVGDRDATAVGRTDRVEHNDHIVRDSFIGTDEPNHRGTNVSWGAIFAGVVVFIALLFVFGLVSVGLGLEEAGAVAVGVWSVIALVVALVLAGFFAGMLGIRAGFLHGMATWAASLVAMLILVGWVGAGVLGALGGAVGNVAQTAVEELEITTDDLGAAADEADVDEQDLDQTQQELEDTAQEAQDDLATSAWWTVAGLLVGAVGAGLAGAGGSRAVHTWSQQNTTRTPVR